MNATELTMLRAENTALRAERNRLRGNNYKLATANESHRQKIGILRVDVTRAREDRAKWPGGPISDLEVASMLLGELRDRLVTEAARTSSSGAAVGLRLAAREVSRMSQRIAARACIEEVAA